jgi:hypothetical protein
VLLGVSIALGFGEIGLRLIGYEYRMYPSRVQFGWPDPVQIQEFYVPDRERLWIPKDYEGRVTRLVDTRPAIVFMGDSCTKFGTYDKAFAAIADGAQPGISLNYANVGVGG